MNLKLILCQNKSTLLLNSYPGLYELNCFCQSKYIGEKKKILSRAIEHQQDSLKRKWKTSGATEHTVECHSFIYFISPLFYFGKNYTIEIEIILFTMSI